MDYKVFIFCLTSLIITRLSFERAQESSRSRVSVESTSRLIIGADVEFIVCHLSPSASHLAAGWMRLDRSPIEPSASSLSPSSTTTLTATSTSSSSLTSRPLFIGMPMTCSEPKLRAGSGADKRTKSALSLPSSTDSQRAEQGGRQLCLPPPSPYLIACE